MAQIFISHSAKDTEAVDFFKSIFSGTNVRAIFEEYEKLNGSQINTKQIQAHINESNCIFILLDENVENNKHTRDWVVWESGYGARMNRDVWLFEKERDNCSISIVIPSLQHYVLYSPDNLFFSYIREIIQSYDNSNVIATTLATTAIGGTIAKKKDKYTGFVLGALTGLAISSNKNNRPMGTEIRCIKCENIYNVHIHPQMYFRCPICNQLLQLIQSFAN
jgi:hypothetical protein